MRIILFTIAIFISVTGSQAQSGFKQTQQTFQRVRIATQEKVFEIWARKQGDTAFKKILFFRMVDTP